MLIGMDTTFISLNYKVNQLQISNNQNDSIKIYSIKYLPIRGSFKAIGSAYESEQINKTFSFAPHKSHLHLSFLALLSW